MPAIHLAVAHALGQQPAVERLQGFMAQVKRQYQDQFQDLKEAWQDNRLSYSFRTFGLAIRGSLVVEAEQVHFDAELPFAAAMFKGKIEREIRAALEQSLA